LLYISFSIDPLSDDEVSLQTLLNCQLDTESALVKLRQLPVKNICKNSMCFLCCNYILDSYPEWSLDEIQQFEDGLREYGKNFYKINVFKVTISFF
jgi:hypothetical protein